MAGERPDWLAEQAKYYRRRAAEYDTTSTPPGDRVKPESDILRTELRAFEPRGRVLEIACGTGSYTVELVPFAERITALDVSPEMLRLARRKVPSEKVRFVEADIFSWTPDAHYDVAFFSFWLSHVPPSHFEWFWEIVASCLAPDGRVFFADEGRHALWREEFVDPEEAVVRRRLSDGSEHHAIKMLWDVSELGARLRGLGWDITVRSTGAFYWGAGTRST